MDGDDFEKWVKESGVELSPEFVRDYRNLRMNASGGTIRWIAPNETVIYGTKIETPIFGTNISEIIVAPKQVTQVKPPVDYDAFESTVKKQKRKLPKLDIGE